MTEDITPEAPAVEAEETEADNAVGTVESTSTNDAEAERPAVDGTEPDPGADAEGSTPPEVEPDADDTHKPIKWSKEFEPDVGFYGTKEEVDREVANAFEDLQRQGWRPTTIVSSGCRRNKTTGRYRVTATFE